MSEHIPQEGEAVPSFMKPPTLKTGQGTKRRNEPFNLARGLYRWFWPTASWFTLLMDVLIMLVALSDMRLNGYNPSIHLTSILVLVVSFAALAATYRWILPHGPDGIESIRAGEIEVKYEVTS